VKHNVIATIVRQKILKKKQHEKAAPLRALVGLIFASIANCRKRSILENVGSFITLQGIKIGRFKFCKPPKLYQKMKGIYTSQGRLLDFCDNCQNSPKGTVGD